MTGIPHTIARSGTARANACRAGYPIAMGAILPRYALSNVARSGATRSNYHSPATFISIGGIFYHYTQAGDPGVLVDSLTISDQLNETPNTATMETVGFIPAEGAEVIITIGSKNNARREFAGHILSTRQYYRSTPKNYRHALSLIDYQWGLDVKKVRVRYTASTVAAIAAALVSTYAPAGYTLLVAADIGAAPIDEITFTEQDLSACLTQLVKRVGGAWRVDYHRTVRLFFTDDEYAPPTLLNAASQTLTRFEKVRDLSQTISRQYVEGGGSNAATDVVVGETMLPVTAPEWYETTGGVVVSGPQRITYAAVAPGGGGGLVGPGAAPSAAPTLDLASGSGITSGAHTYAVTFKTASGESLPGPLAPITVGPMDPPAAALVPGTPTAGSGPDPGTHDYAVTFVTATGETLPGPRVPYTTGTVAPPPTGPSGTVQAGAGPDPGGHDYAVTFVVGSSETTAGPIGPSVTTFATPNPAVAPTVQPINDGRHFPGATTNMLAAYYFAVKADPAAPTAGTTAHSPTTAFTLVANGAWTWAISASFPPDAHIVMVYADFSSDGGASWNNLGSLALSPGATYFSIQGIVGVGTGLPAPTASASFQTVTVQGIPLGATGVTGRKLYRRSGGAGLRLAATINDNTTASVVDTLPNASLGVAAPATNTAALQQVTLTAIPTGGALVTGRKVYRTAAGATGTLPLKLLATLADNATTTFTDTIADASLGATAPASNSAFANQVQVSGIPIGAAAVTSRVLYRTQAGLTALKKLADILDNATTSYLDAISDGSLGAAPPVSDTSGLTQPGSNQVPPGSTTLPVANIGAFSATGGWAIIGNGDQVIRYHGISISTLTGIPASGPGAIVAAISWNSTVTASAALTGIPASGAGSIQVALVKGDEVNLFVQVDDLAARQTIAAFLGTDGIIEDYLQDRRLSHREALARATAQLETKNQVRVEIRYQTRDLNLRSGALQPVNIGPPWNVSGSFLVQSVSEKPHPVALMPTCDAVASNARFTFDEFLRMIHDEVT